MLMTATEMFHLKKPDLSQYRRILCLIVLGILVVNWCLFFQILEKQMKDGATGGNNPELDELT